MMQTKEIKKWLIDANVNMQTIAEKAKVSVSLVSQFISGERGQQKGPKVKRIIRVMKKLGCPGEFLEAANH